MKRAAAITGATALLIAVCAACGGSADEPPAREPTVEVRTTSAIARARADGRGRPERLSAEHIQRRVSEEMRSLRARCGTIPRELDRYETSLHLEIGATGRVETARARGNQPDVDACIANAARMWRFEEASGPTTADVPLVMSPSPTDEVR